LCSVKWLLAFASSLTIEAGGCHFPCKKALWRKGKGANKERKKEKKTQQKQTMSSLSERKASALLWLKWIETKSVHKLKEKRSNISGHRREKKKSCFCHFSANHQIPGLPSLFPISVGMQH